MMKVRKLLSLILVLATMLSVLVLPVAAAIVDEVDPCAAESQCSNCGNFTMTQRTVNKTETVYKTCRACTYGHKHEQVNCYYDNYCSSCGYERWIFRYTVSDICKHNVTV